MSEMEFTWIQKFFATFFPVLGPDFGVGALGIFECLCVLARVNTSDCELTPCLQDWCCDSVAPRQRICLGLCLLPLRCRLLEHPRRMSTTLRCDARANRTQGLVFREKSKTRRALKPQEPSLKDFVLPQHTSRSAASSNIFTNAEKSAGLQSPAPIHNHPSAPYRPTANAAWGSKIGGLKGECHVSLVDEPFAEAAQGLAILNKQAEARQHQISNPITIPDESLPRYAAAGGSGSGRESPAYGSGGSAI